MNTIEKTDKIDDFLLGNMSVEEKNEFERLLSDDVKSLEGKQLKQDMELQKDIILAIKERGLKEMLQKEEEKLQEDEGHRRKQIVRITSFSLGGFSLAAAIAFMLVVVPMARIMNTASNDFAYSLEQMETTRGTSFDELSLLLQDATSAILADDWQRADELSIELMERSSQPMSDYSEDELHDYYQQAEWLHVNCLMHEKKVFEAKRLLKKIVQENGFYSRQAEDILKKL